MADPRKVRQNITEQNRDELEGYGPLLMRTIRTPGRPATTYYLNEEQALLICLLSRTEKAKAVPAMIGRVQSHCT